ncbi:MAG: DUF2283 domain-containing protein [candidate division Zixibacteria bacterium]|nr:DUF2283 domain-containing protein [candidate division Zixibacteria bacterium]
MGETALRKDSLQEIFKMTPYLLKLPQKKMWIDYDEEADVLYISFKRPQKASDSEMSDNGVLLRYRGTELIGITILEASKR